MLDQASGAGGSARLRGAALATSKTLQKDLFGSFCFKFELHKTLLMSTSAGENGTSTSRVLPGFTRLSPVL